MGDPHSSRQQVTGDSISEAVVSDMDELEIVESVESRDWTKLLPDLVVKIEGMLREYPDHFRFRDVCKPWNSALQPIPFPKTLPPQLPWLSFHDDYQTVINHQFFSLSENKYYTMKPKSDYHDAKIPFDGCFTFTSTGKNVTLVNPITGSKILLPPLVPGKALKIRKARATVDKDGGLRVVAIGSMNSKKFFMYHSKEGTWKEFTEETRCSEHDDAIFYEDEIIFASDLYNHIIYDTSKLEIRGLMHNVPPDIKPIMVYSSSGDVLQVKKYHVKNDIQFKVLRYDEDEMLHWAKINNIGDDAIFVDSNSAICLNASCFDRCKSNSIYFCDMPSKGSVPRQFHIFRFDLTTKRIETVTIVPREKGYPCAWILPHLC